MKRQSLTSVTTSKQKRMILVLMMIIVMILIGTTFRCGCGNGDTRGRGQNFHLQPSLGTTRQGNCFIVVVVIIVATFFAHGHEHGTSNGVTNGMIALFFFQDAWIGFCQTFSIDEQLYQMRMAVGVVVGLRWWLCLLGFVLFCCCCCCCCFGVHASCQQPKQSANRNERPGAKVLHDS